MAARFRYRPGILGRYRVLSAEARVCATKARAAGWSATTTGVSGGALWTCGCARAAVWIVAACSASSCQAFSRAREPARASRRWFISSTWTTFCDLKNHRIYDITLGRSEAALESYFVNLQGKLGVRIVCMDLAVVYRSIVRKHFPQALIVADRFHVIRLINHHFLACWREIDAVGSKNRGLLSLMRRHRHNLKPEQQVRLLTYLAQRPALELIYRFKQRLCYWLLKKHKTRRQCEKLAPRFLRAVVGLRQSGLAQLITLGETLHSWSEEIARMWRFTRSNGITEGFHNKMETLNRQAYGFRNFENFRLRVKVLCS